MSKRWYCIVVCDYCKEEVRTIGHVPQTWGTAFRPYTCVHTNLREEEEFNCCDKPSCVEKFQEHVAAESLRVLR